MKKLVLMVAMVMLASCAKYGESSIWGGYDDKEIEPGIWKVTASANGASGGVGFTDAAVLYRAAEIAEAHGFGFIRVLDSTSDDYWSERSLLTGPGYSTLLFRGAARLSDDEGCRTKKVIRCQTLSVERIKKNYAWRVGKPPPAS